MTNYLIPSLFLCHGSWFPPQCLIPFLQTDGVCGQKTIAAVMAFQESHNLNPDGIVGPQTWKMLEKYGKG